MNATVEGLESLVSFRKSQVNYYEDKAQVWRERVDMGERLLAEAQAKESEPYPVGTVLSLSKQNPFPFAIRQHCQWDCGDIDRPASRLPVWSTYWGDGSGSTYESYASLSLDFDRLGTPTVVYNPEN